MFGKQRYRNGALWVSLVSQALLGAQLVGVLVGYHITEDVSVTVVGISDVVLGILSTLGIISNPTKPNSGGYNL